MVDDIHIQYVLYGGIGIARTDLREVITNRSSQVDQAIFYTTPDDQMDHSLGDRHDRMRLVWGKIRRILFIHEPFAPKYNHCREDVGVTQVLDGIQLGDACISAAGQFEYFGGAKTETKADNPVKIMKTSTPVDW